MKQLEEWLHGNLNEGDFDDEVRKISWVVPPPSNRGNEGLVRDSLLKME